MKLKFPLTDENIGFAYRTFTGYRGDGALLVAEIAPFDQDNRFVFVAKTFPFFQETFKKPVIINQVHLFLDGLPVEQWEWECQKSKGGGCDNLWKPIYKPLGATKKSMIYFISGGGLIKIGVTTNLPNRVVELQIGSPVLLTVLATIPGDAATEHKLHTKFSKHRNHGEWFNASPEIYQYIKENTCVGLAQVP